MISAPLTRHLPTGIKIALRRLIRGSANPYIRGVRTAAAISDLYFWMADDRHDTIVIVENYFSRFFPDLDTATDARIAIFDADGREIATIRLPVPHMAAPAHRISELLSQNEGRSGGKRQFGNVTWHLSVPNAVRERMSELREDMLFWDRGYIGYTTVDGQVAFVHGVDKSIVVRSDGSEFPWPVPPDETFTAHPELPVEFTEYEKLEMIVQNRGSQARDITMEVIDRGAKSKSWTLKIRPRGVGRFVIERSAVSDLDQSMPLRLRFIGLPTRFGRPIAMKHFRGGQISLMHC